MEIKQSLEKAGLSRGESAVYLALIDLGLVTITPIVAKSRVSTSKVYDILNRLIKKGLASFITENHVKKFKAEDPRQLIEYVSEKEKELEEVKLELNKNISSLLAKINLSEKQATTSVYEGFKGMKTIFDKSLDELKKGDTLYVSGISESTEEIRTYFLHYFRKQAKIGFKVKAIFDETAKYKAVERKNKLTDFKFLPKGIITPATIDIYGTKTILSVGNSAYILTILIDNKEISDSFKKNFDLLWEIAKS